jgi:hypothetical protein
VLTEIKERYMYWEYDFNLSKEDINWLIETVEKQQKKLDSIREYYPELFIGE